MQQDHSSQTTTTQDFDLIKALTNMFVQSGWLYHPMNKAMRDLSLPTTIQIVSPYGAIEDLHMSAMPPDAVFEELEGVILVENPVTTRGKLFVQVGAADTLYTFDTEHAPVLLVGYLRFRADFLKKNT